MERKTILLLAIGLLAAFTADALTKFWAERVLTPGQPLALVGEVLQITLGYNTGVAFGMFANTGLVTLVLTGIVIVGLSVWAFQALRARELPRGSALAFGFILGGAIGNFADRFGDGRVTDFLDVGVGALRWPTFNIADSFIVMGVALLFLLVVAQKNAAQRAFVRASE